MEIIMLAMRNFWEPGISLPGNDIGTLYEPILDPGLHIQRNRL
jgi:hypothetical protein